MKLLKHEADNHIKNFHEILDLVGVSMEDYPLKLSYLINFYSLALQDILVDRVKKKKSKKSKEVNQDIEKAYKKLLELQALLFKDGVQDTLGKALIELEFRDNISSEEDKENKKTCGKIMSYKFNIPNTMSSLFELEHAMLWCMDEENKIANNKGRPSQSKYTEFVSKAIDAYNSLSGKKFTFQRHKADNGTYPAITDGHKFVYILTNLLNEDIKRLNNKSEIKYETFSDKNIYNAYEKASKIKKKRKGKASKNKEFLGEHYSFLKKIALSSDKTQKS